MKLFVVSVLIFFSSCIVSQSYVELTEEGIEAYQAIMALKFEQAEKIISEEKVNHPDNLYFIYLENYMDFLSLFLSEEKAMFDELEPYKSKRIDQIKKLSKTDPYRNYFLGNIQLQWAVARLKFSEYFTAATEINKSYRLLEENQQQFPDFVPNKISLGVLHIMIGMIPEKYHWMLNLINMHGSVEQGREELNFVLLHASTNDTLAYLKDETLFYLGFVDLNIKPNEAQLDFLVSELESSRNENMLFTYLLANILMRTGKNDAALELLTEDVNHAEYYPFFYLDYLTGECYLRKLDTDQAIESYQSFLENFKGINYIKDANRKIAWCYLINNEDDMYFEQLKKVSETGYEEVDVDKEAEKEAESNLPPRADLLKARLLFDGGYYQKTDSLLAAVAITDLNAEEQTERIYRLGRSADQQNKKKEAIGFYLQTIESGKDMESYFAGNSALKLAELYEREGQVQKALFYYQLCLDLDFDEYETSIHSKAKAGLDRLSREG